MPTTTNPTKDKTIRKKDEITQPASCLNKAGENELLFVLRGHDIAAPQTIRSWVSRRLLMQKNKFDDPQIVEALNCAAAMEKESGHSQSEYDRGLPRAFFVPPELANPPEDKMVELAKDLFASLKNPKQIWLKLHVTRKYADDENEHAFEDFDPPMIKQLQARDIGDMEEMLSGTNMCTTFGERLHVTESIEELNKKMGIEVL